MSVHGYLADKSIFYCNLKLGLLKLQEETVGTSHANINQDNVSLAAGCSWSRTDAQSVIVSSQCSRAVVGR